MEEGLCASGTVEIAGLYAAPDERRALVFGEEAKQLFPELEGGEPTIWIGFRPSFPDTLQSLDRRPVSLVCSSCSGTAISAMTGGPTGAKLVTQLMQGHAPFIDPAAYAASRF